MFNRDVSGAVIKDEVSDKVTLGLFHLIHHHQLLRNNTLMSYTPIGNNPPNKVHRLSNRGIYDAETIYRIIDSALIAHVSFRLPPDEDEEQDEQNWPVIIPMIFARKNDKIYLHGHMSSRLL